MHRMRQKLSQTYISHENGKKMKYIKSTLEVKAFRPLLLSGGMGQECFYAIFLAWKQGKEVAVKTNFFISWIRIKLFYNHELFQISSFRI